MRLLNYLTEKLKLGDSVTITKGMHKGKKGTIASVVDYGKSGKSQKKGEWFEVEFKDGSGKQFQASDVKGR